MDGSSSTIYQLILEILNSPEVLNVLGGLFISIGTVAYSIIQKPLEKLKKWLIGVFDTANTHVLTEDYTTSAMEIDSIISDLMDKLNCARVGIIQFHNGSFFTLSNPIFKMSLVYEALANGFAPAARYIRDVLVSTMITFVGPMMMERAEVTPSGVKNVRTCKKWDDPSSCPLSKYPLRILKFTKEELPFGPFRCTLELIGIEVLYAVLLKVDETKPLGILTIQYHDAKIADTNVEAKLCDICAATHNIQELLHRPLQR